MTYYSLTTSPLSLWPSVIRALLRSAFPFRSVETTPCHAVLCSRCLHFTRENRSTKSRRVWEHTTCRRSRPVPSSIHSRRTRTNISGELSRRCRRKHFEISRLILIHSIFYVTFTICLPVLLSAYSFVCLVYAPCCMKYKIHIHT